MSIKCRTCRKEEAINYSQQTETTIQKLDVKAFLSWLSSPLYLSFPLMLCLSPALLLSLSPLSIFGVPAKFSMIFPFERDKERNQREGWIDGWRDRDLGIEGRHRGTQGRGWWEGKNEEGRVKAGRRERLRLLENTEGIKREKKRASLVH